MRDNVAALLATSRIRRSVADGTGQTLRAAYHLGRDYIGIEASEKYIAIAEKNILRPLPSKKAKAKKLAVTALQKSLFETI